MEISDQQTGMNSANEFSAEDVSDWTKDLSAVILVQRARVRNITDKSRKLKRGSWSHLSLC